MLIVGNSFQALQYCFVSVFSGDYKKDFENQDKDDPPPSILPEDLGAALTSPDYRKYLKADGTIFPGLENEYKAFKWFLKNAVFCVNFELTGVLAKEVKDLGYKDFI